MDIEDRFNELESLIRRDKNQISYFVGELKEIIHEMNKTDIKCVDDNSIDIVCKSIWYVLGFEDDMEFGLSNEEYFVEKYRRSKSEKPLSDYLSFLATCLEYGRLKKILICLKGKEEFYEFALLWLVSEDQLVYNGITTPKEQIEYIDELIKIRSDLERTLVERKTHMSRLM